MGIKTKRITRMPAAGKGQQLQQSFFSQFCRGPLRPASVHFEPIGSKSLKDPLPYLHIPADVHLGKLGRLYFNKRSIDQPG